MPTPKRSEEELLEKIRTLPPERVAEVEDFVEFLARKQARGAALDRLLAIAPALEAAGVPRPTEEAIAAEVKAARAERRTRAEDRT
ncbi:hypothetical protein BURK2_03994 [Burkholderiales bacterium]|jgi:hypothetical protein|nr:hypothetical protein BURK2_03994 [Burkholderiales bacterium]